MTRLALVAGIALCAVSVTTRYPIEAMALYGPGTALIVTVWARNKRGGR